MGLGTLNNGARLRSAATANAATNHARNRKIVESNPLTPPTLYDMRRGTSE
ncbi:hypothetical protein GCM10025858_07620 [Alicyclobacillus sacchari]|nr:hypothetical protein GCM10025858_07620 [Alicyclobacillus sacchari]